MANENEADSVIHPEQRLAKLLTQRLRLIPPVDIEQLVQRYAVLEQDILPGDDIDAIVFTRPGTKPIVVRNQNKSLTRQRFTLAHELGHILIPWHMGVVACHTGWVLDEDTTYAETEAEANRFASELLMPRQWMIKNVRASKGLRSAFAAVQKAGASTQAVSVALVQVLEPGYVFALIDDDGKVALSGISPGTFANGPVHGQTLNRDDYDRLSSKKTQIEGVYWWYFGQKSLPETPTDPRAASLILREMLQSLGIRGARAEKLTQSINGIIGAANSKIIAESVKELASCLRQRFLSRSELRRVIAHEDFDFFLVRRAREILGRRR